MKTQFAVGDKVFVRAVTYHYTGEVAEWSADGVWLRKAAWIADSGRFTQAVATGEFEEVELYPDDEVLYVNPASIVDAVRIPKLPDAQK